MSKYAMICNNTVIEVLENAITPPVWPPDNDGNPVIAIECDDTVERGMIRNPEDNTYQFVEPVEYFEDVVIEKLTESEERQIDILLNTEYIACLLENQLT